MAFNAKNYWESRLTDIFSSRGVGHISFSENYNHWLYKAKIRTMLKMIQHERLGLDGKKVIDVGCGTGFWIDFYLGQRSEIHGLDITAVSIEKMEKKYPDGTFWQKDISSSEFSHDQRYKLVNMWDVMYHIVEDQLFENALTNIANMLEPGGYFVVSDYFGAEKAVVPAEHVRYRNEAMYLEVANKIGLRHVRTIPLYRFLNRPMNLPTSLHNRLGPL
ncbi:MAG: class I SAM-dependent methyltransferase, partial [Vicingaceae bacterium]